MQGELEPSGSCGGSPCCGKKCDTRALLPAGAGPGSASYGPQLNTAVVLLSTHGNVPAERTAHLMGVPVSAGFVDKACDRLNSRLAGAGFDQAMQDALARQPVLGADETPVNLTDRHDGLAAEDCGEPHVLIVRTPHPALTWFRALGSRQHEAITSVGRCAR